MKEYFIATFRTYFTRNYLHNSNSFKVPTKHTRYKAKQKMLCAKTGYCGISYRSRGFAIVETQMTEKILSLFY